MKKVQTKNKLKGFFGLFAVFAMAIGVGVAIAPREAVKTEAANYAAQADFTAITDKSTSYGNEWTYGEWTLFGAANNNGGWAFMKFGGKKDTLATANPVWLRGQITGKAVGSVDVVFNSGNLTYGSVNSWGLKAYSDSGYTTQIASATGGAMSVKKAETLTLTPAANIPAGSYYEVYFNLTNTTTKNGIVWVDKIQFVEAVDASKDLSSLSFTGTPTKKVYTEGETFDPAGLTITATYTDSSTANVTSQVSWATLTQGMTSVLGTYTYVGANSVSKTVTITGLTVNVAPVIGGIIDGHTYLITAAKATDGTPNYLLKNKDSSGNTTFEEKSSAPFTELLQDIDTYTSSIGFVFTKVGANEYTIKAGANFLGAIADNNGLTLGATSDTWKVTEAVGTTVNGVPYNGVYIQETNNNRYLTLFVSALGVPDFRSYTGTTSQPLPAAVMVLYDITALESFASSFNNSIGGVCDINGNTDISSLSSAWNAQATAFNGLLAKEKSVFTDATGNVSGTVIQQAVSKYEYVGQKYSTQLSSSGGDFMVRNLNQNNYSPDKLSGTASVDNSLTATIIIGVIGLTTLAGYYFLQKKKEA